MSPGSGGAVSSSATFFRSSPNDRRPSGLTLLRRTTWPSGVTATTKCGNSRPRSLCRWRISASASPRMCLNDFGRVLRALGHSLRTSPLVRRLLVLRPAAKPGHVCATRRARRSQGSDSAGGFPTMAACRAGPGRSPICMRCTTGRPALPADSGRPRFLGTPASSNGAVITWT